MKKDWEFIIAALVLVSLVVGLYANYLTIKAHQQNQQT